MNRGSDRRKISWPAVIRSARGRRIGSMKHHQFPSKNTTARRAAHLAIGIGAAVLLAATPQLALADAPTATPVDVQAISVTPDSLTSEGSEFGVVRVIFVDASSVAAREVVFQVIGPSGAVRQQIEDKGDFEPGATISHTFEVPGAQAGDEVQVAAVKYADGSTWTANGAHLQEMKGEGMTAEQMFAERAEILRNAYIRGAFAI